MGGGRPHAAYTRGGQAAVWRPGARATARLRLGWRQPRKLTSRANLPAALPRAAREGPQPREERSLQQPHGDSAPGRRCLSSVLSKITLPFLSRWPVLGPCGPQDERGPPRERRSLPGRDLGSPGAPGAHAARCRAARRGLAPAAKEQTWPRLLREGRTPRSPRDGTCPVHSHGLKNSSQVTSHGPSVTGF